MAITEFINVNLYLPSVHSFGERLIFKWIFIHLDAAPWAIIALRWPQLMYSFSSTWASFKCIHLNWISYFVSRFFSWNCFHLFCGKTGIAIRIQHALYATSHKITAWLQFIYRYFLTLWILFPWVASPPFFSVRFPSYFGPVFASVVESAWKMASLSITCIKYSSRRLQTCDLSNACTY